MFIVNLARKVFVEVLISRFLPLFSHQVLHATSALGVSWLQLLAAKHAWTLSGGARLPGTVCWSFRQGSL